MSSLLIGTANDCTIRIVDEYASAHHCRIVQRNGQTLITDLGSTNGTWIEHSGKQTRAVGPTPIFPGCTLILGRTRIPWKANNDGY